MSGIDFHFKANPDNDAWKEESYTAHGGQELSRTPLIFVDYACMYKDGVHIYGGNDCPHYDGLDESGFAPGWTVQQLGNNN